MRMPRTQNEGGNGVDNIPLTAISTGASTRSSACSSRWASPTASSRRPAAPAASSSGPTTAGPSPARPREPRSRARRRDLDKYDIVLLPCTGGEADKTQTIQQNVVNYANTGGRIFTTHYSYVWHISKAQEDAPPVGSWTANPWTPEAPWSPDPNQNFNPAPNDNTSITATIDQTFQKGQDFATWLQLVGATTTNGQIPLFQTRHDVDSPPVASALAYITFNTGTNHQAGNSHKTALLDFTFDTPLPPATNQCGRVLFSDFHVNIGTPATLEPNCSTGACYCKDNNGNEIPLTAQERALEFSLFDIASCVTPPSCTPKTCANFPGTCGEQGDGCGGLTANCGSCPTGQTCGGAGVANQCGAPDAGSCTPMTCASYPAGTCGVTERRVRRAHRELRQLPVGARRAAAAASPASAACPTGGSCTPKTCADYPAGTCGAAERRLRRSDGRLQPVHTARHLRRRRRRRQVRLAALGGVHAQDVRELPGGHLRTAERRLRRPDGRLQPVHASATPAAVAGRPVSAAIPATARR